MQCRTVAAQSAISSRAPCCCQLPPRPAAFAVSTSTSPCCSAEMQGLAHQVEALYNMCCGACAIDEECFDVAAAHHHISLHFAPLLRAHIMEMERTYTLQRKKPKKPARKVSMEMVPDEALTRTTTMRGGAKKRRA